MDLRGREMHFDDDHKQHFACFACRKSFKQRGSGQSYAWQLRPFPCPNCKGEMVSLGRDFQAPPARNRTQWLIVELLHSFGILFEPPGDTSGGPGWRPRKIRQALEFLQARGLERTTVEQRFKELKRKRLEE